MKKVKTCIIGIGNMGSSHYNTILDGKIMNMKVIADRHPELKFDMMFNRRIHCVYRKMRETMVSGELGTIKRTSWIITNRYRPQAYYDSMCSFLADEFEGRAKSLVRLGVFTDEYPSALKEQFFSVLKKHNQLL